MPLRSDNIYFAFESFLTTVKLSYKAIYNHDCFSRVWLYFFAHKRFLILLKILEPPRGPYFLKVGYDPLFGWQVLTFGSPKPVVSSTIVKLGSTNIVRESYESMFVKLLKNLKHFYQFYLNWTLNHAKKLSDPP